MLSSTAVTICNVVAFLLLLGVIAMQVLEVQVYTGSLFGFF
jgi:hypothetical protein